MGPVDSIIFWFRRDLRLQDNVGLYCALKKAQEMSAKVTALFIFDQDILSPLAKKNKQDVRVNFLYQAVIDLKMQLQKHNSDLLIEHGAPEKVFQKLFDNRTISTLYCDRDYEPSAILRDQKIEKICRQYQVSFETFKDQVIFEKSEILTDKKRSYTVFTPYKNKYLKQLALKDLKIIPSTRYLKFLSPKNKNTLGERYFAEKLLDYDLAANNGNWQWAAGTGCDAAPYFRVFNPLEQQKKFDPDFIYIKKWIPEYGTEQYIKPMIEHTFARQLALREYKKGLMQK